MSMSLLNFSSAAPSPKTGCCRSHSFAASRNRRTGQARSVQARAVNTEPNFLENAINALQVRILNSPLNEGKKQFFRSLAGKYDQQAVQAKIKGLVEENPVSLSFSQTKEDQVVVFSWTVCPFAKRAKAILTEAGAQFLAVELDKIPGGKAIKAELGFMTNRTSVPNIFIGGKSIGGCNDGDPGLVPLLEQGRLTELLREVKAV